MCHAVDWHNLRYVYVCAFPGRLLYTLSFNGNGSNYAMGYDISLLTFMSAVLQFELFVF